MQVSASAAWLANVPKPAPPGIDPTELRLQKASERMSVLNGALRFYQPFELQVATMIEQAKLSSLELEQIIAKHKSGQEILGMIARVEASAEELENGLAALDAKIAPELVRDQLERAELDPTVLLSVAVLLAKKFSLDPRSSDRFLAVVSRLLASKGKNGQPQLVSWMEIETALRWITGEPRTDGDARAAAVAFFRRAIQRLDDLFLVDQIFDFGFYLDVRGYEVVLGQGLLDPDIIYVAAELRMVLAHRLREFIANGTIDRAELDRHLATVEEQVRATLALEEAPSTIAARLETRKPTKEAIARARAPRRARIGAKIKWGLAFAFAAALIAGAVRRTARDHNELTDLPLKDVQAISAHFTGGKISRGESETIFVGTIPAKEWRAMALSERAELAKDVQRTMGAKNVESAVIYADEAVVVQIVRGKILFVD